MYVDEKTRASIDATLKEKFGISYTEFEILDEKTQKEVLKNINDMIDNKIKETEKYLEEITINEEVKKQGRV